MTIIELHEMFGTDDRCREILERLRWPDGITCPRCQHKGHSWLEKYDRYECNACQHQFTVISGTIFQDTHLALTKWFVATYLLCESRKGMSANQIKRVIGGSYKTAWYLCHRIRAAMAETNKPKLTGTVEVDETYVGGKERGGKEHGSTGRGGKKAIVIGIRQRGGDLRFIKASDVTRETLYNIIAEHVDKTVDVLVTDEFPSYNFDFTQFRGKHKTIRHKDGVYVEGDVYTNTVESAFSLLKRGIVGTWHRLSTKHLPAYLQEMEFRFNRRKNSDLFIDTLRHMITAPVLGFDKLTA